MVTAAIIFLYSIKKEKGADWKGRKFGGKIMVKKYHITKKTE
jgi:hypothetical protein